MAANVSSTNQDRTGLLLINLGTPDSPEPRDVGRYLRQFLMDDRVIDVPAWRRWLLVNLLIVPFRTKHSSAAYRLVWTDRGSPLLFHSRDLQHKVQQILGPSVTVELGMRYGTPSIESAMQRLTDAGVDRIAVVPLYPQYSSAANGSSIQRVNESVSGNWNTPHLQFIPPFFDHPAFIRACVAAARPVIERNDPELVFFSFHGLPERQVRKSDPTARHCLESPDCCNRSVPANHFCYRAQCFATAELLAEGLGIEPDRRVICFQSRLGRTPWIPPYTDEVLIEHAKRGVKRAVMLSPAFVADCLETLEELKLRAVESWVAHGGESLDVAPCVNADDLWAEGLTQIVREHTAWFAPALSGSARAEE
jgi:ferrochelatase